MKFFKNIFIIIIFYVFLNFKNFAYSYQLNNSIEKNYNNFKSLSPIIDKVNNSVVSIYTLGSKKYKSYVKKEFKYFFKNNNYKYNKKRFEGLGSGIIIDSKNGYIITNNHVIKKSKIIKIRLNNGKELDAQLIGKDNQTDIALLKIKSLNKLKLTEIKLSNSDNIKVGDPVIAIGNPFGLGQTATSGIISAIGRSGLNIINGLENFIQTDASINKGNSGGALINLNGELIGMNTAILSPNGGNIGIGFAIPSNIINSLSNQLIKYGKIERGHLGIKATEITKEISKILKINIKNGIFVSEVISNSPAEKYGIKSGDVIISINNKNIKTFLELKTIIKINSINQLINIKILRNKKEIIIPLKLEKINNKILGEKIKYSIFSGATIIDDFLKNGNESIKIINIVKNSKSYSIGLRKGDFIIKINNFEIKNIKNLKKILNKKKPIIVIYILRKNSKIFIIPK